VLERFDVITTCDDVELGKPHPQIFQVATSKLGILPANTLALEDSNNGMRSAMAAGLVAVMVPDLIGPDADVEKRAFAVVSQDGDADRPVIIDENGLFHAGDLVGLFAAKFLNAPRAFTSKALYR